MPWKYVPDLPLYGFGAISMQLMGADGAYYGLVNMFGRPEQPGGFCPFRSPNLMDPHAFRGWTGAAFDMLFTNPYVPVWPVCLCV